MPVSPAIREKATRLLEQGRVVERLHDRHFHIRGDHAEYEVLVPGGRLDAELQCTCPAYSVCSHIEAVRRLLADENGGEVA